MEIVLELWYTDVYEAWIAYKFEWIDNGGGATEEFTIGVIAVLGGEWVHA